MFEKEAEEYYYKTYPVTLNIGEEERKKEVTDLFIKGAEFGYNKANEEIKILKETHLQSINILTDQIEELHKANEWHYVKDGDYPKEKGNYLVTWKRVHQEYGKWGFDVVLFNVEEEYFEGIKDPIAWKEIVLPKESE